MERLNRIEKFSAHAGRLSSTDLHSTRRSIHSKGMTTEKALPLVATNLVSATGSTLRQDSLEYTSAARASKLATSLVRVFHKQNH